MGVAGSRSYIFVLSKYLSHSLSHYTFLNFPHPLPYITILD